MTKRDLKIWLEYLQTTPLYKQYSMKIDWTNFDGRYDKTEQESMENVDETNDMEMLISQQQSLMWSEEKYLTIAPGQKNIPLIIIYDEHAEELAFPEIYYGVARQFRQGVKVTPFQIVTSEMRRRDRRRATPEHILYMAVKIMRLSVSSALHTGYRHSGDLARITRKMICSLSIAYKMISLS